jgi:hypothetical protein
MTQKKLTIPQQKTLEKVAKSKAFEFKVDYKPFETDLDYREYAEYGFKKGFLEGAEWQQERMYSEEEVRQIFDIGQMIKNYGDYKPFTFKEALEQFKKK